MANSSIDKTGNGPTATGVSFRREFANWDGLRTVCPTFDQDWAPDFMVAEILDLLDRYNAEATLLRLLDQQNVKCVTLHDLVAASLREIGE